MPSPSEAGEDPRSSRYPGFQPYNQQPKSTQPHFWPMFPWASSNSAFLRPSPYIFSQFPLLSGTSPGGNLLTNPNQKYELKTISTLT